MRYIFRDNDGAEFNVSVDRTEKFKHNSKVIEVNGESYYIKNIGAHTFLSKDFLSWKKIGVVPTNQEVVLVNKSFKVYRGFKPSGLTNANPGSLLTQMPGKIVKINIKVGDAVKSGQTLVILEAMKMENEIKAGMDGIVKLINVEEGQALDSGHLMVELE
jgi:biotin carboxyl carrier protein